MNLSELRGPRGSVKTKKRRGRGIGSGHGKTSCRGHKGSNARSGPGTHRAFEGGQTPLIRLMPKRGFRREEKIFYQVVNLKKLNKFEKDTVIDATELRKKGMVRKVNRPIKILGVGQIEKPLTVKANAFSGSAKEKIKKAGGKVEVVTRHS